jgi:glycine betaine/proline transport system ATP-binding protein
LPNTLTVKHLFKIFGNSAEEAVQLAKDGVDKDEIFRRTKSLAAVNNVSFTAEEGEVFVVMGLSGSGKSTLIRCINRLIEPTSGQVFLGDTEITNQSPEDLRQIRLRKMSMVFQHFALLPHKTVAENAEYGLKTRGLEKAERREKALIALKTVGLDAWADAYPSNLSGGMQQRVGLARALAVNPQILLMDEPFSALDPLIRRDMQDEMLRIQEELGTTVIFITHDLQEALKIGDQIAIMRNGSFVQIGTPEEIVTNPADDYVFEFTRDVDRSRVLTFKTIMENVDTIPATMPANRIRTLFHANPGLNTIFVIDDKGTPIGAIRRSDANNSSDHQTAAQIMNPRFLKIRSNRYIFNAFETIRNANMIAVTNRAGHIIGAVDPISVFSHLQTPLKEDQPGSNGRIAELVTG